ncbi:hypothetical protein D6792_01635 [Candidatus Parcubacteria bacterium]|nr:MAG: hypothetical protein D6792_01635 [Candidatus Parcubacteria bacterium]
MSGSNPLFPPSQRNTTQSAAQQARPSPASLSGTQKLPDISPEVKELTKGPVGEFLVEIFSLVPFPCALAVGNVVENLIQLFDEIPQYTEAPAPNRALALYTSLLYLANLTPQEQVVSILQEQLGVTPQVANTIVFLLDHGPTGGARAFCKEVVQLFKSEPQQTQRELSASSASQKPALVLPQQQARDAQPLPLKPSQLPSQHRPAVVQPPLNEKSVSYRPPAPSLSPLRPQPTQPAQSSLVERPTESGVIPLPSVSLQERQNPLPRPPIPVRKERPADPYREPVDDDV